MLRLQDTKNSIKMLVKTGFAHIFGTSVLNKFLTFLSSIVLVRILSVSEYGVFTYAWNIYSFVYILKGIGLDSGYLQLCSEDKDVTFNIDLRNYVVRVGNVANFFLSILLLLLGLFVPLKIEDSRNLILLLSCLPFLQFTISVISNDLRAHKKNVEYSRLTNLNTFSLVVGNIAGSFLLRETGMVVGQYIACIVTLIYGVSLVDIKKNLFSVSNIRRDTKRDLFSISVISMCSAGLSQLLYILDVFTLGMITANENILATYKVASQIALALLFIPDAVTLYIYPYFAEHRQDGKWCLNKFKHLIVVFGGFNLFISVGLIVFSPIIINILYGNKYNDAVPVFRIFAAFYFISATFRIVSGNLLVTQRKLYFNLVISIICSAVNIIGNIILIPRYSSEGAAISTFIVGLISGFLGTVFLLKAFRENMR